MEFTYVNIDCSGCEGWINLFYGNRCIAMVSDVRMANSMRENINEKPPMTEADMLNDDFTWEPTEE